MEDKIICPKCHESDQTEPLSAILGRTFSTTEQPRTEPINWAGKTYFVQKRGGEKTRTKFIVRKTLVAERSFSNIERFKEETNQTDNMMVFEQKKAKKRNIIWSSSPKDYLLVPEPADKLLPIVKPPVELPVSFFGGITRFNLVWILGWSGTTFFAIARKKTVLSIISIIFVLSSCLNLLVISGVRYALRFFYKNELAAYEAKLPKIEQAENLWKELCYCHRDKGVVTPDNKFIELENLENYLFNV